MKKKILLGISLLFLCSGCSFNGAKELTCTNTQNESGLNIASTTEMKFVSNKIHNLKFTMEITPESDLMKSNWSYIEEIYNKQYAAVDKEGLKVSTKVDSTNKKYTIIIDADPTKATKEDLEKYGMSTLAGAEDSYDKVKTDLENAGFSCK